MSYAGEQLWQHGTRISKAVDAFGRLDKPVLKLGGAKALTELTPVYMFFTMAVPYIYGGFTDACLCDFMNEHQLDIQFEHAKFDVQLFAGLELPNGDRDWNYALWALPRQYWQKFEDFMCSIMLFRPDRRAAVRFATQEVCIPDPLACRHSVIGSDIRPVFSIKVFGVNGTDFQAAFTPGSGESLPRLYFRPPTREARDYAKTFLAGGNPCDLTPPAVESLPPLENSICASSFFSRQNPKS